MAIEPTSRMQREVLDYLRSGGTLTQDKAKALFSVGRLSSQINRLREKGHVYIETRPVTVLNTRGEEVTIGEYYIPAGVLTNCQPRLFYGDGGHLQINGASVIGGPA